MYTDQYSKTELNPVTVSTLPHPIVAHRRTFLEVLSLYTCSQWVKRSLVPRCTRNANMYMYLLLCGLGTRLEFPLHGDSPERGSMGTRLGISPERGSLRTRLEFPLHGIFPERGSLGTRLGISPDHGGLGTRLGISPGRQWTPNSEKQPTFGVCFI